MIAPVRAGEVVAGRFAIEADVGSGGMGLVVRARDAQSGEVVALKLLKQPSDPRFEREARILSELRHPGIVRYVAHGEHEGQHYLAMEWLDGEDLRSRLARQPLTIADSVLLAQRIAEALAVAHEHGIVHRDLKPSNLLLCDGDPDRVKIVDFGVARKVLERGVTQTGVAVGTPGYMAPEQATGARSIDGRTDLFALGCVLFRCLTGRDPFHGDDRRLVLLRAVLEEPPRARSIRPEVPEELDELCASLMSKSPAQRPKDAATVAMRLRWLATRSGEGDAPARPPAEAAVAPAAVGALLLASGGVEAPSQTDASRPTEVLDHEAAGPAVDLRDIVARHGGGLELLGDKTIAVTFPEGATRAARCALEMARVFGELRIALVAGPAGDLLARAVALLDRVTLGAIFVDEAAAPLLDDDFELVRGEGGWVLSGERASRQSSGVRDPA